MDSLLSQLELERLTQPTLSDHECLEVIASRSVAELGLSEPPVDLAMLGSLLGVRSIDAVPGLDVAGCLVPGDRGASVRVRAEDSRRRRRFSIAHELGHLFMPGFRYTQYRCSPNLARKISDRDLESLCDFAASRLLLPTALFETDVATSTFSWASVLDLADRYDSSLIATALRFVDLWPEPAGLIVLELAQKPTEYGTDAPAKLRVRWSRCPRGWPWIPRHKSVDDNDVFDLAYQGELVSHPPTPITIAAKPLVVAVEARRVDYWNGDSEQPRVLALLRQPGLVVARA